MLMCDYSHSWENTEYLLARRQTQEFSDVKYTNKPSNRQEYYFTVLNEAK